ncbi:histidinol-phosphatase [Salipiger mucosus]|uniref:Histidinol-phosphatase n=1 Tax=Salipiger mucosus DSM 16094 TaxID=1123237 RepID=S9RKI2_9RHOB|nr:histidinol-phosphatase [Salipiger mucosus]EPX78615.1 Histidinol-phosphatase (alternative form) [Salipiger mucosus DSM 16094]
MSRITQDLADEIWTTAEAVADAARAAILPHFRSETLSADNKAAEGFDPVTVADRAAEAAMREIIAARRPSDAILGEELADRAGDSGYSWVLDPIDGTRGFVSGTPTWGVLVAWTGPEGPLLGLIDQPYTGERFCGGLGRSDWTGPLGQRPMRTRRNVPLDQAILFTTFPEVGTPDDRAAFERVSQTARLTRYGMDCYAYALLAAGQIDLVIEAGLHAYDIQAPIAAIEAAGGVVTDWQGGPAHEGGRAIAAGSPELHRQALERLNG